jgi:hypothetical protein
MDAFTLHHATPQREETHLHAQHKRDPVAPRHVAFPFFIAKLMLKAPGERNGAARCKDNRILSSSL